jgi:catechol 2,3-dioxygenase-like lactoylglutathione lyase family enzyme
MTWRRLRLAASALILALALSMTAAGAARQPVLERPPILGIARAAFRVSSIEPAREYYGRVLGLAREGPPATGGCVRYRINPRQEIAIEPGLPEDEDERLSYLTFETESVETLAMYLRGHGVTPELQAPPIPCASAAARALWVKDPDGHVIAFVESHYRPEPDRPDRDTNRPDPVSTRLLHAGLTIRDPQAADRFYKDVLGFGEIWRGGRTDDVTSWINMKVPNGTDYIEYMLVNGPITRQQRGTLHHVALLVPDIQLALETVRNRTPPDKRSALASPQVGRNHRWQLNLYDPDGTRSELMEPFAMK